MAGNWFVALAMHRHMVQFLSGVVIVSRQIVVNRSLEIEAVVHNGR